jgi:hypothetical protein
LKRALAAALLVVGCANQPKEAPAPVAEVAEVKVAPAPRVEEIASPAGAGAAEPFLSATRDGLVLSWIEPVGSSAKMALRMARYRKGAWSQPRTIVEGDHVMANWADFPSVIEDANGVLFVQWLEKNPAGKYAGDVRLTTSKDDGATWSESILLNRDGTANEHGFATLAALPNGGVGVTWLDGRKMNAGGHHGHESGDMMIRYANFDANGTIRDEVELDGKTCECCTTGMAMTSNGPVIVYRDHSPEGIRDIVSLRREAKGWSAPKLVHADGWKIDGCPVNGPQVDAIGNRAITAWFTAANEQQRVYAAFSDDGGATFAKPMVVDEGKPAGRVDVVMLDENSALVSWLEQTAAGAEIRARRVSRDGAVSPSMKVADATMARAAGFARIARMGSDVWFSWTEQSATTKKVHLARVVL